MPRVVHRLAADRSGANTRTACGVVSARSAARTSANIASVTCKACITATLGAVRKRLEAEAIAVEEAIARGAAPAVFGARELDATMVAIAERSILGDDAAERERAYSWRSAVLAINALVVFRDDGQPVRSTSAVSRFEGAPLGRTENDRAVTALVDRLHGVEAALEVAFPAARTFDMGVDDDGREVPAITLTVADQMHLLVVSVAGTPLRTPKGRWIRQSRSHDGVAEWWAIQRGQPITARQVALVRAAGLRAVSAHLRAIGELEPEREGEGRDYERTKEATVATIPGCDVMGWEAIAEVVEIGEDKCRALAKREDDPLPVYRMRDVRGIGAKRAELTEWLDRQRVTGASGRSKVA